MFVDPILATAALDRLIHHAHVVPITGDSYRIGYRRRPFSFAAHAVAVSQKV